MIPGYRTVLAAAVLEGARVCRAAGIPLTRVGGIHPGISPYILVLPNVIYSIIARSLLKLSGDVYSSMWEDLHRQKPTEIDYINGEIVALAKKHGSATPVNDALILLIRKSESSKSIPSYSPHELLALTDAAKHAPSPLVSLGILASVAILLLYTLLRLLL